jgi:hypothetical protein
MAKNYLNVCHIDKLFPCTIWKFNHNVSSMKPRESASKHFTHGAMEVWSTLFSTKPIGIQNKNIISYSMSTMLYEELELKQKVD